MPPVEQIHISDLTEAGLPERLPRNSQLKVWVRSTGYEVRFSQRGYLANRLYWLIALGLSLAVSYFALGQLQQHAPYHYLVLTVPAAIATVVLFKFFASGHSRIRLDITPMTIAISYLDEANRPESQEHVPLKEIESFYIDSSRGLGLNSTISEIIYRTWIGSGLHREDLYYLAKLIVQSSKLSMQRPHPGST